MRSCIDNTLPSALPSRKARCLGTIFFSCLMALLAPDSSAQAGKTNSQEGADAGKEERPEKRPGLIEIARTESRKQKAMLDDKIEHLIHVLAIYTDPELTLVQQSRKELLSYGAYSIPHLVSAMEDQSVERTRISAGKVSALILAKINAPSVEKEALRMLAGENTIAKANATRCLGEMGLVKHLDKIKANLDSKDENLLEETILCIGRMQSDNIIELVKPFFVGKKPRLVVAAIKALDISGNESESACDLVIFAIKSSDREQIKEAAYDFIESHGTEKCIPALTEKYGTMGTGRKERYRILSIMTTLGASLESTKRKPVVEFLKTLLSTGDYDTVKKAAYYLNMLGDESGLRVLTGKLDNLITRHGNAEYYFYRGEIYLRFKKYKQAKRDFLEGLRKDKKAGRYGADKVFIALARCYAAEDRFLDAERNIRKSQQEDTSTLPEEYEEFKKMAKDPRYSKVFKSGSR